ncbi:flagellar motor switch protein FliN [Candidatus Nitrospira salsa]|nr:MAG: hypothetical protein NPIRA01_26540 [Nitrospirales bacterium]
MSEENPESEESFDPDMDAEAEMAKAMAEAEAAQVPSSSPSPPTTGVMPASEMDEHMDASLDRILDIPLVISAQLGSAKMLIKELLQLGPGSVVELDKLAGEPLEVLVNEKLVARGEVVMVNEKFGIRLTDVVSQTERVNNLS